MNMHLSHHGEGNYAKDTGTHESHSWRLSLTRLLTAIGKAIAAVAVVMALGGVTYYLITASALGKDKSLLPHHAMPTTDIWNKIASGFH